MKIREAAAMGVFLVCLAWSLALTGAGSFLYALSRDSVLLFFCQLTPGCLPDQKSVVASVCERVDVVVIAFGITATVVLTGSIVMLCTHMCSPDQTPTSIVVHHGHQPSLTSIRRNVANTDLDHPCSAECIRDCTRVVITCCVLPCFVLFLCCSALTFTFSCELFVTKQKQRHNGTIWMEGAAINFIYWTEIVCWILLSTSVVYTCVRTLITRLCATEQAASSRSTINVDPKPDTNKPLFNLAES